MRTPAPWFILHRAGDHPRRLQASRAIADYVEADLRLNPDGGVSVRHDPLLWRRLPWLTTRHHLPRLRLRRFTLADLPADPPLFLDFKEPEAALVERTVEGLRQQSLLNQATASTPHWEALDRLAAIAPEVGRFYSLGKDDAARWPAYQQRIRAGQAGAGVSLHHTLATPARLEELARAGLRAIVYPVNTEALGRALLRAGAAGLTTDRLELINRWRAWWATASR